MCVCPTRPRRRRSSAECSGSPRRSPRWKADIAAPPEAPDAAGLHERIGRFAERFGFPSESKLLRRALTHRSAAATLSESSERLEFLGDALLSVYVARILYDALPEATEEGALSRARVQVIRRETLAEAARRLGMADVLTVGRGERKENRHTHDSLLADAFEALIAAIFLEQGEDAMQAFLAASLAQPLADGIASPPEPDPKTRLQMRLQALGRGLPSYKTIEATGIGHDHHFVVEVVTEKGQSLARGEGPNKRIAQTEAARTALASIGASSSSTHKIVP